MKRKNKILIIVFSIVILLTIILLLVNKANMKNKERDFSIPNIETINKIFLADKSGESVLLEKSGAVWVLNEKYYATEKMVRNMLNIVRRLKVREPVASSAHNNVIGQLSTTGVKVELYGEGYKIDFMGLKLFPTEKILKTFYVGTHTKDNLGTFMIMENSNRPFVVYIPGYRGFVSSYFSTDVNDWRAHIIFNHTIPQITEFIYRDNEHVENSYSIKNIDSRSFELKSLADNNKVAYDTLRLIDLLSSFSELKYEYVIDADDSLVQSKIDSVLNTVPAHELTLRDKYGLETTVKTFRIPLYGIEPYSQEDWYDKDRLYGYIRVPSPLKDEKGNTHYDEDFVVLQYFVFDNVLRPLKYLKQ